MPCPPSPPAPSGPPLPDAVSLNDGSFALQRPSFLGLRPTKPSPNFHFSHPQNRRSPAKHWRSLPQLPSTKKVSVPGQAGAPCDDPSSCQTRQAAPISGLRPTKPSPNFHFSYPPNRRSPAKHWKSLPERRRKKILSAPAESGRSAAVPNPPRRSGQFGRTQTEPNTPNSRSPTKHMWSSRKRLRLEIFSEQLNTSPNPSRALARP